MKIRVLADKFIKAAVIAVITCCLCLGCSGGGRESKNLITYVSSDSTVASTTADVVKMVADSVVEIRTESITTQWGMQYIVSGAGSGVIVSRDADYSTYYIITNNHVVEGASQIQVTLRTGDVYSASLVAADVRGDIAVVKIKEDSTLNMAVWGNSDQLQIGEDLIAIGNPLGSLGGTVTKGILSATARAIPVGNYTMTLLQTDTAINPGNSGGGLFNMRGELVGVVNAKTSDEEVEGICFAIPSNTARSIFGELVVNGYVTGRVTLGIKVGTLSSGAVYVSEVTDAPSGTFERYDRIAEINGVAIGSALEFNDALAAVRPGNTVSVTVYRGSLRQGAFGSAGLVFDTTPTAFTVTAQQLTN